MHLTIFYTPIIQHLLRAFSRFFLMSHDWKCEGRVPEEQKYIVLAGPHTSNWDFPYMIACASILRADPYWMGKKAIFFFPFGWFFKWMGGISIDRDKSNSLVDQMVEIFSSTDKLCVLIPPEGTRKRREKWKSGFYHIAQQAKIPLVLGYLDYEKKVGAFGELYWVTGDYDADMKYIQEFYATKVARYPEEFTGDFLDQA